MRNITALLSGALFALGLGISGMMNPAKVQGFLDLAGVWDPSLAFVMGGALSIGFFAFKYIPQMKSPKCETSFCLPTKKEIDGKLIGGSILFGMGWALSGLCPGPALANLLSFNHGLLIFITSMLGGMKIVQILDNN